MEIKEIPGLPGYLATTDGRIYSQKTHKFLSQSIRGEYLRVGLINDGERKSYSVHRLVAETFIPNPNNLPQVNHKDENKLNNNVDNLEWVTVKDNANHGTRNKRISEKNKLLFPDGNGRGGDHPEAVKIAMCDPLTHQIIKEFSSIADACHYLDKYPNGQPNISAVLNGRRKTAYKFFWKKIEKTLDNADKVCYTTITERETKERN